MQSESSELNISNQTPVEGQTPPLPAVSFSPDMGRYITGVEVDVPGIVEFMQSQGIDDKQIAETSIQLDPLVIVDTAMDKLIRGDCNVYRGDIRLHLGSLVCTMQSSSDETVESASTFEEQLNVQLNRVLTHELGHLPINSTDMVLHVYNNYLREQRYQWGKLGVGLAATTGLTTAALSALEYMPDLTPLKFGLWPATGYLCYRGVDFTSRYISRLQYKRSQEEAAARAAEKPEAGLIHVTLKEGFARDFATQRLDGRLGFKDELSSRFQQMGELLTAYALAGAFDMVNKTKAERSGQ